MPNCFTLTKKGQATPSLLSNIDEELCAMLGKPVHPTKYVIDYLEANYTPNAWAEIGRR